MTTITQPTCAEVKEARRQAGMTQRAAGEFVHVTLRAWQNYEQDFKGDGISGIPLSVWELFNLKRKYGIGLQQESEAA